MISHVVNSLQAIISDATSLLPVTSGKKSNSPVQRNQQDGVSSASAAEELAKLASVVDKIPTRSVTRARRPERCPIPSSANRERRVWSRRHRRRAQSRAGGRPRLPGQSPRRSEASGAGRLGAAARTSRSRTCPGASNPEELLRDVTRQQGPVRSGRLPRHGKRNLSFRVSGTGAD